MDNNDILRKLRYAFDFGDDAMIEIFQLGSMQTNRAEVSDWLKKDDDEQFKPISDKFLAAFLNGLIVLKRGKKEGVDVINEVELNNNLILRKLKIALSMKDVDMVETIKSVGLLVSKHEINAFFRKPGQNQYRQCQDQFLRNFLAGIIKKNRP